MGGFFGAVSKRDVISDVFFGVDYHSHLGTRRGGMAAVDAQNGFQREIHNIETAPFRTKFERAACEMRGCAAIGCISDSDPQPILIRSALGLFAICVVGVVQNAEALTEKLLRNGAHFDAMAGGRVNAVELVAAMIIQEGSFKDGICRAQAEIDGTASVLILTEHGELIAARDRDGRLPIVLGQDDNGYCVSFESFAAQKLGYESCRELGPGEVVRITPDGVETLQKRRARMRICAFLWAYYGYPNSCYEGVCVETARYRNGGILARDDRALGLSQDIDYVSGVPDSGTPHAIGYSNASGKPFARPFIKYTPTWPRSFMPANQSDRNRIAKMKQIPVHELIDGQRLLLVDDSIVRGTQLRETVEFLYENGAKEVHIRSACPPIMYGCRFLNFSRSNSVMELIARRTVRELEGEAGERRLAEYADAKTERGQALLSHLQQELHFTSLRYQTLDGILDAIGLDRDSVCTYCWDGKDITEPSEKA